MDASEIYYRVNTGSAFDFMTLTEINATSRDLLQQLLDPAVAEEKYVKVGDDVRPYDQWLRERAFA